MRTDSRWLTSAGENPSPNAASQAMPVSAAVPSRRVAFVEVPVDVGGAAAVLVLVAGSMAPPTRR
jgi:hypothetical protein